MSRNNKIVRQYTKSTIKTRTKIGLKYKRTHVERITLIFKLNVKLQCLNQVYVIIVMHVYFWVEL